jgi:O-succinylbenzoic acid--CoA ligase
MTSSSDWLRHQAEVNPTRLALCAPDGRWTFAALNADVARLAGVLSDLGVRAGHRVVCHLSGSGRQVLLVHSLFRLGAVLVPLNIRLTAAELAPIISNADPGLLIHDGDASTLWDGGRTVFLDDLFSKTPSVEIHGAPVDFDALHALVYTSGTTGTPKGVELTVGNQWWSAVGFSLNAGMKADDRWLNVMPLFHVGGLTILFRSVIHGSAVHLMPRFDAVKAYNTMESESVTLLSVVPTMLRRLLDLGKTAPSSLRVVLLGGAPAAPSLIAEARRQGYPAVPTYGMTETCSQIVTAPLTTSVDSPLSGHANLPTQIRITVNGGDAGPHQSGEIWVKGPTVARGYWNNSDANRSAFVDGWLRTGDVGWMDANGNLTVTDRLKDLIIRGGENISPREVEDALLAIPGVQDAAVYGVPHPEWGQQVACALVSDEPLAVDQIRESLSNRLASYKIPSIYYCIDAIPRNAAGKILRAKLAQAGGALDGGNSGDF